MRTLHTLSVWFVLAALCGCHTTTPPTATNSSVETLAGKWRRGDGLGYNISLDLGRGGAYVATWTGCLGDYGTARGKWTFESTEAGLQQVHFSPISESGMLVNELTLLDIAEHNGQPVLVPTQKQDRKFFNRHGATRLSCFQKQANGD